MTILFEILFFVGTLMGLVCTIVFLYWMIREEFSGNDPYSAWNKLFKRSQ